MSPEILALSIAALIGVPLVWATPRRLAWDALAAWTALVLALLSPLAAGWALGAAVGTPVAMMLGDRWGRQGLVTLIWGTLLISVLFLARGWTGVLWIGGAYFTLRNLHVLFDWWLGRMEKPGLRRHLRYQLVLPLLAVGPIHRIQHFERQCDRRRWDTAVFFTGAERALFGVAMAVVLGGWLCSHLEHLMSRISAPWPAFWRDWLLSAAAWVRLYFTFAGFSGLALGLTLMMGLRLEENFNHPWKARNLIDFWTRWHITLSQWCRDYVFQLVAAITRSPLTGLTAAMIAMGLWHETSGYYVLWSFWQVMGIVATRKIQDWWLRRGIPSLPGKISLVLGPICVFGWLSLAHPVLTRVLEFLGA